MLSPCALPRQPSPLNNNKQLGNRMPMPGVLPGQPSLLNISRQSGNGMPLLGVLPGQPNLLNNSRQSGNGMPLPGVLPGQPSQLTNSKQPGVGFVPCELGSKPCTLRMRWRGWWYIIATPLWAKCEGETHTPKSGNLESSGTPKNSEDYLRGQISSHWCAPGVIEKVLKCRCPKWPRMSHLDICNPSYGQKKDRESNWQFDSRPLKVRNRPLPDVRSRNATWRWKALFKEYKFGLDLVLIGGRGKELQSPKVPGVQTGTVSGLHFESPGKKSHLDATPVGERRVYYREYGGGISWVRAVVCHVSPS
jgi:hypothetical protein